MTNNKQRLKRNVCLFTVILMVCLLFSGCGDNDNNSGDNLVATMVAT